jgi:hypothetical protein
MLYKLKIFSDKSRITGGKICGASERVTFQSNFLEPLLVGCFAEL